MKLPHNKTRRVECKAYLDVGKDSKGKSQDVAQYQESSPVVIDYGSGKVAEVYT